MDLAGRLRFYGRLALPFPEQLLPARLPSPAVPEAARPRLARGSGRNALQAAQREATRRRLLDAARAVFKEKSYALTSVDDILACSQVSRAAFYSHFDGKIALVKASLDDFWPVLSAAYAALGAHPRPDTVQLEAWVASLLALFRAHVGVLGPISQAASIEPGFSEYLAGRRVCLIERIGERLPAFAAAVPGRGSELAEVRAALLLHQIDLFCDQVAVRGWPVNEALAITVLAENLHRFIHGA